MFIRRSRRNAGADAVEPDLPITPMLDMSFQLLAFFIMTFRPAPTEGQIAMTLPKEEGGEALMAPSPFEEKPARYIVKVETERGQIRKMTLKEAGSADEPKDLGVKVETYRDELQKLHKANEGKPPPKLTLEIEPKLFHEYVVQLLDVGVRVGFTDIAPVPAGKVNEEKKTP
jgi:biopolymer transport protein ExbD